MDTYWWKQAKIYELYIDKFATDINGLTNKLEYFNNLGINCLHLLPHYPSPMDDDGYDVSDYRGVRRELGTIDDFKQLVRNAKRRGIRIIIDLVLNHTSEQHPWFVDARSSKTSSKRDYYLWSDTGTEFALASSGIKDVKEHNWIPNPQTGDYFYATYYPQQPDLNWDNARVFEEMMDVMLYWAEIGVSGFRLDAAPRLVKREGTNCKGLPETHTLLKRIRARLEKDHPDVILMAEAHHSIEDTKKYFGKGDECHMAYHFSLMENMWVALERGDQLWVQKTIDDSLDIPDNCQWAIFLRNHDEISLDTLEQDVRTQLVTFLDPQKLYPFKKGEATSMRIASVFNSDREKMRKAFQLLYSLPGSPIMYYGDEIGMLNLPHEDAILDSRKFVRGEFNWDAAREQERDPTSLLNEVAALIKLTKPDPSQPAKPIALDS